MSAYHYGTITLLICISIAIASVTSQSVSHEVASLPSYSLSSATGAAAQPSLTQCSWTYTPPGGVPFTYDLSPMVKTVGDYTGADTAYNYKANVCGTSVGGGVGCTDKAGTICQYNIPAPSALAAVLGSYSSEPAPVWSTISIPGNQPEPYTAGVMMTFTNGDQCYIAGKLGTRTVLNVFRCAQAPSDLITVSEDETTCTFTVTFQSTQACPGAQPTPSTGGHTGGQVVVSVGLSGGWIFIIILLVILPIYIAVGCVYKVKKTGAAFGRDSCPNGEFWGSLPGLVKDGCVYTVNKLKSLCKKEEAYNEL